MLPLVEMILIKKDKKIHNFLRKLICKQVSTCIFNPRRDLWNCTNNLQLQDRSAILQIMTVVQIILIVQFMYKSSRIPPILQKSSRFLPRISRRSKNLQRCKSSAIIQIIHNCASYLQLYKLSAIVWIILQFSDIL